MVFDVAVLVKSIIAVSAKIHGVVPLRGRVVYFFGEVYTLFTPHVGDGISVSVDGVERLSCALTFFTDRVLRW